MRNPGNPNVSAALAVEHLAMLSAKGVGRRAVAEACDLDASTIFKIRTGRRKFIRLQTLFAITGVTADAPLDNALVDAEPALKQIRELLREGFTKKELARRLGYPCGQIQYRKRMKARNVARVDRFYRRIMR